MARDPIRYDPSLERPEPHEAETDAGLVATMRKISDATFANAGRQVRSVHAKAHAVLHGELRVGEGLPATLAQGMFARPGAVHPVAMRLSTNPGDVLDDDINVGLPRGMAVKVMGVEGVRLPGSEDATTQDFLLVNGPAFLAKTAKEFLGSLKLLAATADGPQIYKRAAALGARGVERLAELVGLESPALKSLGGSAHTNPLGETFYSQVPLRFGDHVAKLAIAPIAPALLALKDAPLPVAGRADAMREAMVAFFRDNGAEWELRVQLCTDLDTMPIEDASAIWPEAESPYRAVARITAPPQDAWSAALDEQLAFSPWHGIEAHRPLGGVMRLRRSAYAAGAALRGARNGCPMHEPRGRADLPA